MGEGWEEVGEGRRRGAQREEREMGGRGGEGSESSPYNTIRHTTTPRK